MVWNWESIGELLGGVTGVILVIFEFPSFLRWLKKRGDSDVMGADPSPRPPTSPMQLHVWNAPAIQVNSLGGILGATLFKQQWPPANTNEAKNDVFGRAVGIGASIFAIVFDVLAQLAESNGDSNGALFFDSLGLSLGISAFIYEEILESEPSATAFKTLDHVAELVDIGAIGIAITAIAFDVSQCQP